MDNPLVSLAVIVGVVLSIALICRLIAGAMDGGRIRSYIMNEGHQLLHKRWAPFGPGWFGERRSRIYDVVYKDHIGRTHQAYIKTSMMTGVYLTGDRVIEDIPNGALEEERARLKERLAEIEQLIIKQ